MIPVIGHSFRKIKQAKQNEEAPFQLQLTIAAKTVKLTNWDNDLSDSDSREHGVALDDIVLEKVSRPGRMPIPCPTVLLPP